MKNKGNNYSKVVSLSKLLIILLEFLELLFNTYYFNISQLTNRSL